MNLEDIRSFLSLRMLFVLMALASVMPARGGQRQFLSGHVPPAIGRFHLPPIGRLPAQEHLSLTIGLPLRNNAQFHQLVGEIYNPASPEYHRYLTPQQIADRFGPAETDYEAVAIFAQTNGLQIVRTYSDRTLLTVEGTVADIEKTFHIQMLVYQHPSEARTFYAPDTKPSVDLSVPLLHINGFDNYSLPCPGGHSGKGRAGTGAQSGGGSGPSGSYLGQDFRNAYVPGSSLTGAGQSVGLLELDGYYTNDIRSYEALAGLPNVVITNVLVDGATGTPNTADTNGIGEVSLDMEMVMAMAPGISRLIVYEAPNCCSYWEDIIKRMQEDDSASQLSSSWLWEHDDANLDTIYQELAMQGQSFFQCSGDSLAFYNGDTGQWTDDPNVTLIGGTMLTTANNGSWSSETVWNNGDGVNGSGGGVSTTNILNMGGYPVPGWQKGINMTTNSGSNTNRNVPDVAMLAYNAWVIWNDGESNWWWGTSIAAPLWAGMTALANQQAAARSEPSLGFLNPALYAIGNGPLYASCFHDITTGNNVDSGSPNLYFAVPGYDLCTGWGTPNGVNLINILTQTPNIYGTVRNTNGSVTFLTLCVPASTNVLYSATNLVPPVAWKAISTNVTGSTGTWQFTDTNASHYKMRFYRLQSYPPGR
ncbi:MAG TPA: S53 family serine peptidase [Candidatus Acidoferrales bacterium]|nr:S53 family serine peptidase [Candidatus Acidoferrales bacterium]